MYIGTNVEKVDYQIIRGKKSTGSGYEVHKTGTLTQSKPEKILNEDMVYVEITRKDGKKQLEFHMEVSPRKEFLQRNAEAKAGIPLNVMIIGLDSTSHAHFQRKLAPVYKYMKDNLHSKMFNGYSILGDGTTAAVVGLLVGRHIDKLKPEGRKG